MNGIERGHDEEVRNELIKCLDADNDGIFSRADALDRLEVENDLPVDEPNSTAEVCKIISADVRVMNGGKEIAAITRIVRSEGNPNCDECGYDTLRDEWRQNKAGEIVDARYCQCCDNEVSYHSTL